MLRRVRIGGDRLGREATSAAPGKVLNCRLRRAVLLLGLCFAGLRLCCGYGLLTHEELVDILWQDQIQPLLLQRYPGATATQLRQAHAYAYGGSLLQDIGYYPFGSGFFSDLTHGVRTGDFVAHLLRDSADLDEYAFALGALTHYAADSTGHPFVNRATALCFPRLRARYGDSVTFADCRKAHMQTEYGFDITEVAKHRFTSDRYHDFIGFEVAEPLLERAFVETYGISLEEGLGHVDLAIGTFRRAVSDIIPEMTRAALTVYHPGTVRDPRGASERRFLFNLSRAQYEHEWGTTYRRPGFFTRVLGFVLRLMPKVGLLKALDFKRPTPQTEALYVKSVDLSLADCRRLLGQAGEGNFSFPNLDCDTGRPCALGEYTLTDETYAHLLEMLIKTGQQDVRPALRTNILAFYADADPVVITRKQRRAWQRSMEELDALRAGPGSPIACAVRERLLAPPPRLESPKASDH
jgi:Zinc dependent phospholipase C